MEKGEKLCRGLKCKNCNHTKDLKEHEFIDISDDEYCVHKECKNCDYAVKEKH